MDGSGAAVFSESADGFRLLAENSTDMVARHDREGRCTYASPACERLLGYSADELVGTDSLHLFHPNDLDLIPALAETLREGDGVRTLTSRAIRKDGRTIWVETTVRTIRDDEGRVVEAQTSTRDVTERVQAEELVSRSEALHRSIAANLPSTGIFLFDRDLKLLLSHGNALNKLPWYTDEDFEGKALSELAQAPEIPAEIADDSERCYRAALHGEECEFEFTSNALDFVVRAIPVRDDDGEVDAVLVVAQDVTERRRDAEALETYARKQRAVARLGQLALRERDLESLLRVAARTVAETLGTEFSAVIEYLDDPPQFCFRASEGWHENQAPIPLDWDSQAGYTMRSKAPVVVEDFATEDRFKSAPLIFENGVVSGLSVVIEGRDGHFGVLSATRGSDGVSTARRSTS